MVGDGGESVTGMAVARQPAQVCHQGGIVLVDEPVLPADIAAGLCGHLEGLAVADHHQPVKLRCPLKEGKARIGLAS